MRWLEVVLAELIPTGTFYENGLIDFSVFPATQSNGQEQRAAMRKLFLRELNLFSMHV